MAVYSYREVVVRRREWFVPVGTNHAEVSKAHDAAARAYLEERGLPANASLSDDALWFTSDGEEIVIYFESKEEAPPF